ncbi:coiled-coil domain-containing protein 63-like [Onthophagus taurus]|uniref:coiled-coil domain-containing protein 63-like n=1 Tax=Onthophagus taurus TaxID=166361 RepID=UPI0039BEA939
MKNEKKELTPAEKFQAQLQLEAELFRLQRQYQILERDRKIAQEGGNKLSKLGNVIRILKKEHHEILTDLCVAASENNLRKDALTVTKLKQLLSEHSEAKDLIKQEKGHLEEMEEQIWMVTKALIDLKSKQVSDEQCQQRVLEGQKTLEALENKLETANKRFCTILTDNTKLRAEIDHLLHERAHFNELWERVIKTLSHGKKFMIDLIEQATIAYDQREEWCHKLQALRTRAKSDLISHTQEMRELERRMDHDVKLETFLSIKGQKRVMRDLAAKERRKRELQREELEKELAAYKEMLANITEFTHLTDIGEIAAAFIKQEEENFALFSYISALNKQMEFLSDELQDLHFKIDQQKEIQDGRCEKQKSTLEILRKEVDDKNAEADQAEKALKETEKMLNSLLKGIDNLFKICKCSNAPLLELLGNNASITNYNVLLYLETLEKKVTELIMAAYYKEKTDKKKVKEFIIKEDKIKYDQSNAIEEFIASNPCPLCVEQEQVSDVIDSLQLVLNKEEVKEKLNIHLSLADSADVVHNVSACHLPKSREIIQKRYQ